MKVSDVMTGKTLTPAYAGDLMTQDFLLAIKGSSSTTVQDYVVAVSNVTSYGHEINPETSDKSYMSGKTTVKTGTKPAFTVAGDRLAGDAFQEYCLSHAVVYGTGSAIETPYIYFNMITGKGEQGTARIIVNKDSSGDAISNATFEIQLVPVSTPTDFTYTLPA